MLAGALHLPLNKEMENTAKKGKHFCTPSCPNKHQSNNAIK